MQTQTSIKVRVDASVQTETQRRQRPMHEFKRAVDVKKEPTQIPQQLTPVKEEQKRSTVETSPAASPRRKLAAY